LPFTFVIPLAVTAEVPIGFVVDQVRFTEQLFPPLAIEHDEEDGDREPVIRENVAAFELEVPQVNEEGQEETTYPELGAQVGVTVVPYVQVEGETDPLPDIEYETL
jgi:hypothetical protein